MSRQRRTSADFKYETAGYPPLKNEDDCIKTWRSVPWLRLRGYWLQQAEFGIDQKIRIKVSKKRWVIKAE